ncbi:hypothetical protein GF359_10160 [candidate division WOR-3 bacterium]|uniref:Leucine-rich repeat domain-containing protein n=1 Tax=candidate division WOR-3 bacterium TaxID=2052148 RepID=A0A9D5QDA9_UNCW3|nr:hypothetical protein [candidate division WOR-3 bacterium]MBD3365563.1 hypothetical protein [candidate division WOR-3 bacterium]
MQSDQPSTKVTILENGEEVRTEEIQKKEQGNHLIYLGGTTIPYVWQGEERIEYEGKEGTHMVNGKVYGVELAKVPFEEITSPEDVKGVAIKSEHFKYLPHFPNLLTVSLVEVDPNQMHYLAELSKVIVLDFGMKGDLTDEGLSHLISLTEVRAFNLLKTPITDTGLAHLSNMKKLETLWLQGTNITGAGLVHLTGIENLSTLGLGDTDIQDSDLAYLKDLQNISALSLINTPLTDEAVEHLIELKKLEYLDIRSTNISEKGIQKLKYILPGCKIQFDSSTT